MTQRLSTIWTIAYRELATRARSKAFRISTAVLLLSLVLGIVVPAWAMRGTTRYTVAVVTAQQPALQPDIAAAIAAQAVASGVTVSVRAAADRATAVALVEAGTVDAAVVGAVVGASGSGEIVWSNADKSRLAPVLASALTQVAIGERARALGLSPAQLAGLFAPAEPTVTRLHARPDRTAQTVIALIGVILLFVALNFYGTFVLTGVVEEKSSRVVEVLLARVPPADLLAGKVLGIGVLGIGQFAALGAVAAATLQIVQPPQLPVGTVPLIAGVVLWFVLGYSFYSVLYGAMGALASRTEDAQVAAAPITAFLLLAYFGAFTAIANPTGWWITTASLFPPTAPIYMPLRVALTDVPAWQVAVAIVLMTGAILALVRVGGRLYRGGVLHTAGRLRIRQAWRAAA